jgi:uncharacterized protein YuzE
MAEIKRYNYDKESDSLLINIKEGEEDSFEEVVPGVNLELNKNKEIIGASKFLPKNLSN